MSMSLMVKAMSARVGNPLRKLVLIKLADNANDMGECWPSYQHIADQCEIGRSTVKGHIKALSEMGFLRIETRRRGNGNSSNVYHLTIAQGVYVEPVKSQPGQDMTGAEDNPTRSDADLPTRSGADPRTSHSSEPVKNHSHSGANDAQEPGQKVFDRSRQFDDSGKPLTAGNDQIPMSLDWSPDQNALAAECVRRGLPMDMKYTVAELADFTGHYADSHKRATAHGWVINFAKWIHENRRREAARNQNTASQNAGGTHAAGKQRPRQYRTAQEARAAAQRQSGQQPAGQTFDGEWAQGER